MGSFALLFLINVPLTAIMLVATLLLAAYSFWRNYQKRVIFTENRKKMADINAPAGLARRHPRGEVVRQRAGGDQEVRPHERPLRGHEESSYRFMRGRFMR